MMAIICTTIIYLVFSVLKTSLIPSRYSLERLWLLIIVITFWEHEMEWVEVDEALVPLDLVRVANAPADGVEDSHDDAAGQHDQPREQQQVCDADEDHAS